MLPERRNELLSSCFLVVFCLFVRWVLFVTRLGSCGSLEGRRGLSKVASEKPENILIASYLMEEFIFSGIFVFWLVFVFFGQCICIALQLSWFVKASCAVSGLFFFKGKKQQKKGKKKDASFD